MVANLNDEVNSWYMDGDGDYRRVDISAIDDPSVPTLIHDKSQPFRARRALKMISHQCLQAMARTIDADT